MGIFRKIYIEARDLLGMGVPAENDKQKAERIAGQLKDRLTGKVRRVDDDFSVQADYEGRQIELIVRTHGERIDIAMTTNNESAGPVWTVRYVAETPGDEGAVHINVAKELYAVGLDRAEATANETRFTELALGPKAALTKLLQGARAEIRFSEGIIEFEPGIETLNESNPVTVARNQLKLLLDLAVALDTE